MPKRVNKYKQSSLRRIQEGGAAEDNFRGNGSTPKTRKRILPLITCLKWKIRNVRTVKSSFLVG